MALNQTSKFYPAASDEIASMLGLNAADSKPAPSSAPSSVVSQAETSVVSSENIAADVAAITGKEFADIGSHSVSESGPDVFAAVQGRTSVFKAIGRVALAIVPYIAVFAVGVFVYYGWFADPSNRPQFFKGIEKKAEDPAAQKKTAFASLQKSEKTDFDAWIRQYYYSVSDQSILAMDYVAPNKLTNFENYLLKLNPKTNDIRKTGSTDAETILSGLDPVTGAKLADWQRDVVAQYFDTDAIKQRTPGGAVLVRQIILPRGPAQGSVAKVAGAAAVQPQTSLSSSSSINNVPSQPHDAAVSSKPTRVAPATGNGDCAENKLKINTSVPGRLEVPAMGVNVPIIWTKNEKDFDIDLNSGVVHYPCTPLPGDIGTSYISGHSSNYSWVKAEYNKVFAKMGDLQNGTTFKVTVVGQDGKDIRLYYVVERKQVYEAGDQAQFVNTAESVVALSTCWPINTTKQRMVAFGRLDRVER